MVSAKKFLTTLIAGSLMTGAAFAGTGITITVADVAGSVGSTVVVSYGYAGDDVDDVGGFQFDLTYDPVALTPTDVTTCANNAPATHTGACTEPGGAGNGAVRTLVADFVPPAEEIMPLAIDPFGEITFMINQPGTHTLTFTGGVGSDISGANVAINGNNATVTGAIVGSAGYGSTPAPGSTIDFGGVLVGGTSSMAAAINVTEIGDQQLDVMAPAFTTGTDFASTTAAFMIADGGAGVDVEASCTPTARGALTDTVTLANNSVNEPAAAYDLTCAGLSPNVDVAPTVITLSGIIGLADPTGTFDITNAQDGFTSDALNAALSAAPDAPEITFSALADGTISIDETDTITATCSTAAPGNFTETITLTYDDIGGPATMDVVVNCEIINEIPEYTSVPTPGSTIDFGAVLNGTTSANMGVDIGNTNTDAVPNGTLTITAAAIAGPDAAIFTLVNDPTGDTFGDDVAPDGTNDAEVTCSPTDGFSVFTATLTITSNDGDTADATYPLTCTGDSDATFDSNPAPGSEIDFGVLLPGMDSDEILTLSNTGTSDPLSADSCTLAGDAEFTLVSPVFPAALPPGGSVDVVLNCAPTTPGLFSATLSCDIQDGQGNTVASPTYDLSCAGAAVDVPTLSQFGLIALIMTLMFGGFIAFRLRQN